MRGVFLRRLFYCILEGALFLKPSGKASKTKCAVIVSKWRSYENKIVFFGFGFIDFDYKRMCIG